MTYRRKLRTPGDEPIGWKPGEKVTVWAADERVTNFLKKHCGTMVEQMRAKMKEIDPTGTIALSDILKIEESAIPEDLKANLKFYVVDGMHRTLALKDLYKKTGHHKYR